jgi:asparagine synthase (glutamine-hydrolysing)
MSGWVAIIGNGDTGQWRRMLTRIKHRGPDIAGWNKCKTATIGQNYLEADLDRRPGNIAVPLVDSSSNHRIIGYDGQIGNWRKLADQTALGEGPFLQERIILRLHGQHGKKMFQYLTDTVFALIIADDGWLAARDLLGIKTLFHGRKDGVIYLGSEMKSVLAVTGEVFEFPAGHYMDQGGRFHPFAALPHKPPQPVLADTDRAAAKIRTIIEESVTNRVTFSHSTGSLLSGGIDSSVVAMLANRAYKSRFGARERMKTFALGVGETGDIISARLMARHIDSDHHEKIVDLQDMLDVLDDTIYHLESFDPSLVRSAVANFLISRYAREQGIDVLLSGEGGDELFCGYLFLKDSSPQEMFDGQIRILKAIHNNAALRLDRMNQCNGVTVVAPLISGALLECALSLAPELKIRSSENDVVEKWIFRHAFAADMPEAITWRLKQEFSQGSGSAASLTAYFENACDDAALAAAQSQCPLIRSKEELYYYNIFKRHFGADRAVETVGQWMTI